MNFLYELFEGLPRGGPGSNEYTRKAFRMLKAVPENPQILDVGCGKGEQTLELARLTNGHVIGLDNHQPFLDDLEKKASDDDLSNNIEIRLGNMFKMPFSDERFDIIWSEGAIYIMGFEEGQRSWRRFLKPEGYIVVSELSWLKDAPPEELCEYWNKEYPGIKSIARNLEIIQNTGYQEIGHFTLPEKVWWESLYTPMEKRVKELKIKYKNNPKVEELYDETMNEIGMFRKYSEWYGYEFYIMQKND